MTDSLATLLIMDWRLRASNLRRASSDARAAGDRDTQDETLVQAETLEGCANELEASLNNPNSTPEA